jgi:beta-phosphoglucomutase family hydrolase
MKKLAYILDMDGVLIDSNPLHAIAWRQYLSRFGLSADTVMERMHGKRNDQIVRGLFGRELSDQEVFGHGAAKEALYRELMRPHVAEKLLPGVADFLRRNQGRPMGVASNAEPANLDFVLDESGLRRYFQAVMDGHKVTHPKPDPEIYLAVAARLGVAPADCVIFEDSPAGLEAGRAAGARIVAVRSTGAELPPADFEIRDFRDPQLEPWLCHIESSS